MYLVLTRSFCYFSVVLLIAACSHNPYKLEEHNLLNANPGVRLLPKIPAIKVPFDDDIDFEINEKSTVLAYEALDGGTKKSYCAFLDLPNFQPNSHITIRSYCSCGLFGDAGGGVFVPTLDIFDKDYVLVERLSLAAGDKNSAAQLATRFAFKSNYKYILVYSNPVLYGKPAPRLQQHQTITTKRYSTEHRSHGTYNVETTTRHGVDHDMDWYSSITGKLNIEVEEN